MTSKFRLMDLPEELFDNVIAHYVHSVPVNDASATRAVSRVFDQAISYQIIHHVSKESFKDAGSHRKDVFTNISADYLGSAVRKRKNEPLVTFIDKCADTVLGIEGKSSDDERKTRYLQDIIRYTTRGESHATYSLAIHPNSSDHIQRPSQRVANLTSAAAVGSLVAVKHLLRKYVKSWPSSEYLNWNYNQGGLSDAIGAAASNGHVKVLQHLLNKLRPLVNQKSGLPRGSPQHELQQLNRRLHSIFCLAIRSKHCLTIQTLADFAQKYKMSFGFYYDSYSPEQGDEWIKNAVRTGCVKTFQATISTITSINPKAFHALKDHYLKSAFWYCCRFGQEDILQYLIAQDCVLLQRHGRYGMKLAARHLCRNIITILLENGVSINDGKPVQEAIKYENISIVEFMIAHGARVDAKVDAKVDAGTYNSCLCI
ncbi:unnamed protein product [Alternaria alternata]|uniref:uncharacterized protein n=1 Tax=Alternaria postmessia TaxID=1187938 RepID=UPI002224B6DF|nr:uncharacterized protein J4E82_008213 [Alternaria postmessia]KAI5373113.1 hypothetical protein J4E82_008213 [Alternaria postmessia]